MTLISIAEINRRNRLFWEVHQHDAERQWLLAANSAFHDSGVSLGGAQMGDRPPPGAPPPVSLSSCGAADRGARMAHLDRHILTRELKRRGAQARDLEGIDFWPSHSLPFTEWSWRALSDLPPKVYSLARAYAALKWLILEDPPHSRDRNDAWDAVVDTLRGIEEEGWRVEAGQNAKLIAIGLRTKKAQSERARKPRGKIEGNTTIRELIAELIQEPEYREASAKGLWPPLFAALEKRGLDPEEIPAPKDRAGTAYAYCTESGRPRRIAFGHFSSLVSKLRRNESRQPG